MLAGRLTRARFAGLAALVAAVVGVGAVWAASRGGSAAAPAGEIVTAERGDVVLTVGGVGHVTTLTGAARLSVPSGPPSAGGTAGGAGGGATSASSSGASQTAADAVFTLVAGHVTKVHVHVGEQVIAGQPIATLSDDGTLTGNVVQARGDLATARLELAQKRVQDPARGAPPTPAEVAFGRDAVVAARAKLERILSPPLRSDVRAAQLDVAKADADLAAAGAGAPQAIAAAGLAAATAQQRLQTLTGAPDPAELAAAQLELAKATLDQEALLATAPAPSAEAVHAADLAVELAQVKLTQAQVSGTAVDVATARAELAKAQSDRAALTQPSGPSAAARAAAQLAVDAAHRRVDAIVHPSSALVTAARAELAKTEAELATVRSNRGAAGRGAAQAAVDAARAKLARLLAPATHDVVSTARSDLGRARADLAVMRQRGGPAGANDLALARLKVDVAAQRLALAQESTGRLVIRAPSTGTITSLLTTAGAAVDSATPVARVQDLAHLVVTLDLSEFDVGRTRVGVPSLIKVEALGGKIYGGHVVDVALSGVENGGVVNFPVIIGLNSRGRLRPGMSVSARIIVSQRRGVVRVPVAAVNDQGDSPTVMVRDRSGALRKRVVEVGLAGATYVEVRSGLRAGERVLVAAGGGA
jgi:RND family efflux transporter MFP subunit